MMSTEHEEYEEELDARYFQNDIVATAFEIFEKTSNFDAGSESIDESDRNKGWT